MAYIRYLIGTTVVLEPALVLRELASDQILRANLRRCPEWAISQVQISANLHHLNHTRDLTKEEILVSFRTEIHTCNLVMDLV